MKTIHKTNELSVNLRDNGKYVICDNEGWVLKEFENKSHVLKYFFAFINALEEMPTISYVGCNACGYVPKENMAQRAYKAGFFRCPKCNNIGNTLIVKYAWKDRKFR